jgi:hypothetical protein
VKNQTIQPELGFGNNRAKETPEERSQKAKALLQEDGSPEANGYYQIMNRLAAKEQKRYVIGKTLAETIELREASFAEFSDIQKEYITALGSAKRGEKSKIKDKYNPLLDAAGKQYGAAAEKASKLLKTLESDLIESWGRTTIFSPGGKDIPSGKEFLEELIQKYMKPEEIAQMPKLGLDPPLADRDINIKEKPMSDLNEGLAEEKNLSPRELAFRDALYHRVVITVALKNGTLSCLPGKDGFADTEPAVNFANRTYHGDNQLYLKEHQKENGYPTAEYTTQAQIEKAREDGHNLFIRKGEKGVSLHFGEKSEETGKWEDKHVRLFNVAQLNNPKGFKKWAEDQRLYYLQTQYGTNYSPEAKPQGPEIVCSTSDPVKYLGQYFAAVSMRSPFKVDKEVANEFAKNFGDSLYEKIGVSPKTGDPVTDPFKLSKVCRDASQYCREFMKELNQEQKLERQQKQEQTLEHQQSRGGRSR